MSYTRRSLQDYLRIADLKHGALYLVASRSARVGVWDAVRQGFDLPREKWGVSYLFFEQHWDAGGSAKPIRKLADRVATDRSERLEVLLKAAEEIL